MKRKDYKQFIREDAPEGDVTSVAIFGPHGPVVAAQIVAKQNLVVSGLGVVKKLLHHEFGQVTLTLKKHDGAFVKKGTVLANVKGPVSQVLTCERVCLNILQHLSGIATQTKQFVDVARPFGVSILDTRKTIPGWRAEQKQAVRDGGGQNHRMNLSDQYLIKDNHVDAAGGVIEAIKKVRAHQQKTKQRILIEVEVRDENEFCEALLMQPDMILLDNMTPAQIRRLVRLRNKHDPARHRPWLEISGGVTIKNIDRYVRLGVERISIGALTHSVMAADMAMKIISSKLKAES